MSITYTVLVGKPKGNSLLDVCGRSWKTIIKLYLTELGYYDVVQDSDQWKHGNKFRDFQRRVGSQNR
jgi:hypothetical protein